MYKWIWGTCYANNFRVNYHIEFERTFLISCYQLRTDFPFDQGFFSLSLALFIEIAIDNTLSPKIVMYIRFELDKWDNESREGFANLPWDAHLKLTWCWEIYASYKCKWVLAHYSKRPAAAKPWMSEWRMKDEGKRNITHAYIYNPKVSHSIPAPPM